jgi:hypothetical protein
MRCLQELGADVNRISDGIHGCTALYATAYMGHSLTLRCLAGELGADVNRGNWNGATPLYIAAQQGHVEVVRSLGKDFGADANRGTYDTKLPLTVAAENGHLDVVKWLVLELDVDVNRAKTEGGITPLMDVAWGKNEEVIRWPAKHGANAQQASTTWGTAADISRLRGAPAEQSEYLTAKAHCLNPTCSNAGLTKCTGCKQARYCGQPCQLLHKVVCKEVSKMRATEGK